MPKLVCFDLWETLVTEPSTPEYCWEPFAEAYPAKISWPKVRELTAQILHKKKWSTEQSIREILKNFDVIDDTLVSEICKRWEYSCDQVELFPETLEVLVGLREMGLKLGIITNTSRYGWEATNKKFLLSNYFDYLALSFKLGYVKPEPEIFESIERASGLSGSEIMMIGDSYKNDFETARDRGWGSILLDRLEENKYPEAKPAMHDLLELRTVLN